MSRPQFVKVLQEMRSRYETGVPQYVHSFINGMITGLEQYGVLDESEVRQLKVASSEMLEAYTQPPPRMIRGGDGSHWDGCEETHWDCKIKRLEEIIKNLRERNAELEARLDLYHGNMLDVLQAENEKLKAQLEDADAKLSLAAGWKNVSLAADLRHELGLDNVPMDQQLEAALNAVRALKAEVRYDR